MWCTPSVSLDGKSIGYLCGTCANAAISPNATFAVSIMDTSRYSKSDKAAWMTQLFAVPIFFTMTEFLGCTMAVANDLMGLFPKYINIRRGQFICAVVSFDTCPWKIQARAENFLAFLGAATGIVMVEYFMIRCGYGVNIARLFKRRGSIYWYTYGVNRRAFVPWFVALAPYFRVWSTRLVPVCESSRFSICTRGTTFWCLLSREHWTGFLKLFGRSR